MQERPINALKVPVNTRKSIYPEPYAAQVAGRVRRRLGDFFGLGNFGINLTQLAPGAKSALLHRHSRQDEFIYVLEGSPTLKLGAQSFALEPGDCHGFRAGDPVAHQLVNDTATVVTFLEIGDRTPGDEVTYPDDDLRLTLEADGSMRVTHKDGRPY